jgi:hypothetical protein
MVNGNTWPKLSVEARRYRMRLLNGCDSRTLVLNRAPGEEPEEDLRAAEVRFARFFNSRHRRPRLDIHSQV